MTHRLLIWLCLTVAVRVAGQSLPAEAHFSRYTVADGLPDNNITCLTQDQQGFIWVGTGAGLSCFDGVQFTNYFKGKTLHNSLPSNYITSLTALPGGKIVVGTRFGLSLLDTRKRGFKSVHIPYQPGMEWVQNTLGPVVCTPFGEIIVGNNAGICVFDTTLKVMYQYNHFQPEDLKSERMGFAHSITPLSNGDALIRGWNGFWRYHQREKKVKKQEATQLKIRNWEAFIASGRTDISFEYANWPDTLFIHQINNQKKTASAIPAYLKSELNWRCNLGFVTDTLLGFSQNHYGFRTAKLNPQTLQLTFSSGAIFKNVHFNHYFYDREKRWWLASENGLFVQSLTQKMLRFVPFETGQDQNRVPRYISAIAKVNGHFFVSANTRIFVLDSQLQVQKTLDVPSEWHNILRLYHWQPNVLEVGTSTHWGRLHLPLEEGRAPQWEELYKTVTLSQIKDRRGMLWTGGTEKVLRYDSTPKKKFTFYEENSTGDLPYAGATYMVETDSAYIWMCGPFSFSRWNPALQKFDRQYQRIPGTEGKEGHYLSLTKGKGETLLFALYGNGLWQWNGNDRPAQRVPMADPALDFIFDIEPDTRSQHYWLALKSGIALFDLKTRRHHLLPNITDRMLNDGISNKLLFFDAQTDSLYVLYEHGVLVVNTKGFHFSAQQIPVYITGLRQTSTGIDLPLHAFPKIKQPNQAISISFAAPDYEAGSSIRYAYRINGRKWQQLDANAPVRFVNLAQGKYLFEVKSITAEGVSSQAASLHFEVLPLFYQTWWFKICLTVGFVLLVWGWFRWRLRQLYKLELMRQHIAADLHDEVGASLTSIQILAQLAVQEDSPRRTAALNKLPEQVNHTATSLREIVWNIQPENNDLNLLIGQLMRYAGEFLERADIFYSLESPDVPPHLQLDLIARQHLVRIFKEALNNLAKHSQTECATIRFKLEKNKLFLQIEDQGIGFDPKLNTGGNGLNNMKNRAQLAGGSLLIDTYPGKGTLLLLSLPLRSGKKWYAYIAP